MQTGTPGSRPFECQIESLAAGGDGVARAPDGRTLFVPFAAPGDRLLVRVVEDHSRFARGEIEALLAAGESRTAPACPAFGTCGGCSWQHVRYEDQLAAKARILREALRRIGRLEVPDDVPVTPSPTPYHYRTRARVLVRGRAVGYRARRSHRLCPVARCPVLEPALEKKLAELAAAPPPPGEWEIASGDAAEARVARVGPLTRAGRRARAGGPEVAFEGAGGRVRISPGVFAQANAALLAPLCDAVCRAATGVSRGRRLALELYSGAGTFTLPLARHFERVVAVESAPAAVRDLRVNARAASLPIDVRARPVEAALAGSDLGPPEPPDVVVLDPPRAGLSDAAASQLARLGTEAIVYVSCDPATLARDLRRLCERAGPDGAPRYALSSVRGFDLFPQTPHVEALAVLRADPRAPGGGRLPGAKAV